MTLSFLANLKLKFKSNNLCLLWIVTIWLTKWYDIITRILGSFTRKFVWTKIGLKLRIPIYLILDARISSSGFVNKKIGIRKFVWTKIGLKLRIPIYLILDARISSSGFVNKKIGNFSDFFIINYFLFRIFIYYI